SHSHSLSLCLFLCHTHTHSHSLFRSPSAQKHSEASSCQLHGPREKHCHVMHVGMSLSCDACWVVVHRLPSVARRNNNNNVIIIFLCPSPDASTYTCAHT